jgi:LacI family transcriptional regulator
MRDVAELAGVGTMTVSRVLSGVVPVSDDTRSRVMAAIEQLDYRPNEVARSLREARTRSIGVIVPNFYDSFFAGCAHAVNLVAQANGYSVMVTTSGEDCKSEYKEASLMLRRNVEGIIAIPAYVGESQLTRPEFETIPIVTLDRPIRTHPAGFPHLSSVLVENRAGSRRGVEHLIEHGHKTIVFLGLSNELYTLKERHVGYVEAMKEARLTPEAYFSCGTQEGTLEVLRSLRIQNRLPTAIFTSNNLATQHALHALAALKISIPKKIAVVAFDDLEMFDIFVPPITVVRQPNLDLGRIAAKMLFARLQALNSDKLPKTEGRKVVLPVDLILRRSCGCE